MENVVAIGGNRATSLSRFDTPDSPIMFPVVEREVQWVTRKGDYRKTEDYKALVRVDDDGKTPHLLCIVGDRYKLVHNRELFDVVERAITQHVSDKHLEGVVIHDSIAGHGLTCYRQYTFPNLKCDVGGGARSHVSFRAVVQNGYGGSGLRMMAGAIEFWCSNGMVIGEYESTYRRHTSGLIVTGIDHSITNALRSFTSAQEKWKRWAHTPVKHEDAMSLFRSIASSPRMFEKFSDRFDKEVRDRGDNVWSVYSTLTYYASHGGEGSEFRMRDPSGVNAAALMMQRQVQVSRWTDTKEFNALVT